MAGQSNCPQCGGHMPASKGIGRPRTYCSLACTQRAVWAAKAQRLSVERRSRWPTHCVHCGKEMQPAQNRTLCSNACKVAVHKARDPVRTRTAALNYSAMRRSWVEDGEQFDPFEIFERDGWRCHLCGDKTPKRLRGTKDPMAPELDHIIPLSKGGKHTRLNTACSHKGCNMKKRDRLIGQLRLVA